MGVKLQLLGVLVVISITIQRGVAGGCWHGDHDPPDPARSHKLPCKRPDAPIHCPCPNCHQEFDDAEEMQEHIDAHHPDCYYCRREGIGGRGPDSPVSCQHPNDDDHYWSDSDFTTEAPFSSGESEPEEGTCTLGMCHHYKHPRPMWSNYDSRTFYRVLSYYIRKIDPEGANSDPDLPVNHGIANDKEAAARIRIAEACFAGHQLRTGHMPSRATTNYREGVSTCENSAPSTSSGHRGREQQQSGAAFANSLPSTSTGRRGGQGRPTGPLGPAIVRGRPLWLQRNEPPTQ